MIKVAVLGKDGKTGKAVIARLENEPGYTYCEELNDADILVVSPGIAPYDYPKVNIPIISEIELAYRLNPVPVIGITGTNGKTTTTTLISRMLGIPAVGNIGKPYISVTEKADYYAVELSSYQLYNIKEFKPKIAVILNISEDHLSWHGDMTNYIAAKKNLLMNQNEKDFVVYNEADINVMKIVDGTEAQKVPFSAEGIKQDYEAARKVGHICGLNDQFIDKFLSEFKGVEHRNEVVGVFGGIKVINDSKATNVDSTVVALKNISQKNKIILIAGGRDKNTPLLPLAEAMKGKVKEVILLGEARERFSKGLKDFKQVLVDDFKAAVLEAVKTATNGDIILLSPACASWDMFENFEERGNIFKALIKELMK